MKTLQIDPKKARSLYKGAATEFKEMLADTFGAEFFSEKITDRVKSWEDACEIHGVDPISSLPFPIPKSDHERAINAFFQITIIAEVLNEGWQPNWKDSNEYKYYAWFEPGSASGFSSYDYVCVYTLTCVGSRLCFKTAELAKYAGNQFLSIYKDFMTF